MNKDSQNGLLKNDLPLGCIKESYFDFNDAAGFK